MVFCADPYRPVPAGTEGTVQFIDDLGTLHVKWRGGRLFGVCLEEDEVERI